MEELWRVIPESGGLYEISNQGRVRSWSEWTGRRKKTLPYIIKPTINRTNKRLEVKLKGVDQKVVKTLMRDAWMEGHKPGFVVTYKNGNYMDCSLENLVYMKRSELHKGRASGRRLPVTKKDPYGEVVCIYPSIKAAAKEHGVSRSCMSLYIKHKQVVGRYTFAIDR